MINNKDTKDIWSNFFINRNFNLFKAAIIQNQLIQLIIDKYVPESKLLEVGIGSGVTLVLLSDIGFNVSGVDYNDNVLDTFNKRYPEYKNKVSKHNIMSKGAYNKKYDVIYSQGTMEHFNDDEIIKILKHQIKYTNAIIFDVPNNKRMHFNDDEIDNTRFESPKFWEEIVTKAGLKFNRYGRNLDILNDWVPPRLAKYDSWLMRHFGRTTIMECYID